MTTTDAGRAPFGVLPGGETVERITLTGGGAIRVSILTYGASLQSLLAPDRHGVVADVALGHATLAPYLDQPQYMGGTVGRVANRIARGRFTLDGEEYQVPVNNGANSLHGGTQGFDKCNWQVTECDDAHVVLRLISPDGDQGYPGTLTATATYRVEGDKLSVEYLATADRPTLVNLSSHAYWNLAGEGAAEGAMGQLLTIPADHYLPTDSGAIPTGEIRSVTGSPFDFRRPTEIGARVRDGSDAQIEIGRGYDHNWVVARDVSEEPRLMARVEEPISGRAMEILSNQPGLQFYSGNFLDGTLCGKAGQYYRMGDAIALEPQMFPDTPNQPQFGSVRLDPGQTYRNVIVWRFSADAMT